VIPFNEINRRLDALGKDRKWLAEASKRSPASIAAALAPSAPDSKRSKHVQKALSDAIEAEEERQRPKRDLPPGHVEIILSESQYQKAQEASQIAGYTALSDYCRVAIEDAADRLLAEEEERKRLIEENARKTA